MEGEEEQEQEEEEEEEEEEMIGDNLGNGVDTLAIANDDGEKFSPIGFARVFSLGK